MSVREAWQVCFDTPFGRDNQAGMDNAWEQEKLEASVSTGFQQAQPSARQPKNARKWRRIPPAEAQRRCAPWNDGGRSFYT